jgi:N-acetylglucosamine kinase-like BadF-type ATPase
VEEELLLGVDGGKSKTVCLLAEASGQVLGWGRSGSSDKYHVPTEQALDEIARCVQEAAQQAGLAPKAISAGCFGLAGADWPEDFEELEAGLTRRLARRVLVKNDTHIALRANSDTGIGVVVSAGTHTAAAIRTPDGREWHSVWFSVEGPGGVTAGHKALWSVLRAYDGRGEKTALTELVLSAKGKSHPLELLRDLSAGIIDDTYLASLAPLVFQAHFRFGDPVATRIIMELGKDVARWATGLLERFGLLNDEIAVVLSGGLFKGEGTLLLDVVTMEVHAQAPKAILRPAKREPVIGALLYALEMSERPVNSELIETIELTAPGPEFYRTD